MNRRYKLCGIAINKNTLFTTFDVYDKETKEHYQYIHKGIQRLRYKFDLKESDEYSYIEDITVIRLGERTD